MVKSAEHRERYHRASGGELDFPRLGSVALQGEVRTGLVVVADVFLEDPPEGAFTEDDQVIEAFPTDGPDDPLGVGVLPGGLRRRENLLKADGPDPAPELVSVDGIPVPEQKARLGPVPRKGLRDLLCGPFGDGMSRDVEVENAPPFVEENDEAE